MRPGLFAVAAFVCLALAGCGVTNSTPGCGAEEALDLVKEIIQREAAAKSLGGLFENVTLEYVSTTAYDKELDAYSCSANLVMYKPTEEKVSMPFTFNVRPLATDPTQFVVQVFGL